LFGSIEIFKRVFLESHCYFSSGIHHPADGRPDRASLRLIIFHTGWFAIRSWGHPAGGRPDRASLRLIIFYAGWFAIRSWGHPEGGRPDRASLRLIIFHAGWFAIRSWGHPDGGRQDRASLRLIIFPLSIPDSSFGDSTDSLGAAWIKGYGVKFHLSIWFQSWVHRGGYI
jgi:hypothetical protein